MARKPRLWSPGFIYHITARGNRKGALFYDQADYATYLDLLKESALKTPFTIHSYCLMTNHIHLLLETKNDPPGSTMKFIHSRYANYFNNRHQLSGHVFQGRYHADIVNESEYFLQASRYIHLNPLEANMVTKPEQYPWSSLSAFLHPSVVNEYVYKNKVLSYFPQPSWRHYNNFIFDKKGGKRWLVL